MAANNSSEQNPFTLYDPDEQDISELVNSMQDVDSEDVVCSSEEGFKTPFGDYIYDLPFEVDEDGAFVFTKDGMDGKYVAGNQNDMINAKFDFALQNLEDYELEINTDKKSNYIDITTENGSQKLVLAEKISFNDFAAAVDTWEGSDTWNTFSLLNVAFGENPNQEMFTKWLMNAESTEDSTELASQMLDEFAPEEFTVEKLVSHLYQVITGNSPDADVVQSQLDILSSAGKSTTEGILSYAAENYADMSDLEGKFMPLDQDVLEAKSNTSDSKEETDQDLDSNTDTETESESDSDTGSEKGTETDTDTVSDTGGSSSGGSSSGGSDSDTDSDSGTNSDSGSETESDTITDGYDVDELEEDYIDQDKLDKLAMFFDGKEDYKISYAEDTKYKLEDAKAIVVAEIAKSDAESDVLSAMNANIDTSSGEDSDTLIVVEDNNGDKLLYSYYMDAVDNEIKSDEISYLGTSEDFGYDNLA